MRSLISNFSAPSQSEEEMSPSPRILWTQGWRCDQWQLPDGLFAPSGTREDGTKLRQCAYCGMQFLEPPAYDVREHHLRITHKSTACVNKADLYLDFHLFFHHLGIAHNAKSGTWTRTLLQACSVQHDASCEPTEDFTSFAVGDSDPHCAESSSEPAWEESPDATPQSNAEALMMGAWDSNLLGEWNSGRDRINRWMLHMLGPDPKKADIHHALYQARYKEPIGIPRTMWSRLVLKYWFIDEVATGVDLTTAAMKLESEKLGESSLHLSARPSGTASDAGRRKNLAHRHNILLDRWLFSNAEL